MARSRWQERGRLDRRAGAPLRRRERGNVAQQPGERHDDANTYKPCGDVEFRVVRRHNVLVPVVEVLRERSERGQDQDNASRELENAPRH